MALPLVKTPAGVCVLVGKMKEKNTGRDLVLVQQGVSEQLAGGIPYSKVRQPCATWIFAVCWKHQRIFAKKMTCSKCDSEKEAEKQNGT